MDDITTPRSWAKNSTVTLCHVGFDRANQIIWTSNADKDQYFNSQTVAKKSFIASKRYKLNEPINLPFTYDEIQKYNYVIVDSAEAFDGQPKYRYYYWITSAAPTSRGGSQITVACDYWTTYNDGSMSFGNTWVDKSTLIFADTAASDEGNYPKTLRDYWAGVDSLSGTGKYVCTYKRGIDLQYGEYVDNQEWKMGRGQWLAVVSTVDLFETNWGYVTSPLMKTSRGNLCDGLFSGCDMFLIKYSDAYNFMSALSNYPWVSENIIALFTIPYGAVTVGRETYQLGNTGIYALKIKSAGKNTDYMYRIFDTIDVKSLLDNAWGSGYSNSAKRNPIFNTGQWCNIVLTNSEGNQLVINPEFLESNKLDLYCISCMCYPYMRIGVFPWAYGANANGFSYAYSNFETPYGTSFTNRVDGGDWIETALWLTQFPQFSIVNNEAVTFMASTARSRSAAIANANDQRNFEYLASNKSREMFQNTLEGDKTQMFYNWVGEKATNLYGGISDWWGNLTGGIDAVFGTTLKQDTMTGVNPVPELMNFINSEKVAQVKNADISQWLGQVSADKAFEMTMREINASVADASITSPTVSGLAGGDGIAVKYGYKWLVTLKVMRPVPRLVNNAALMYARFGVPVGRYARLLDTAKIARLTDYFTYIQASESYPQLTANIGDEVSENIRQMFAGGVTLWAVDKAEFIGRITPGGNNPGKRKEAIFSND